MKTPRRRHDTADVLPTGDLAATATQPPTPQPALGRRQPFLGFLHSQG